VGREDFRKIYVIGFKRVNSCLADPVNKKGGIKNEGITKDVYENKLDTKLTWVKFSTRPECL
jgi:hypothetical protein